MVEEDEPQRDASAGIDSQVASLAFQLQLLADHLLGSGDSIVHLSHPAARWAAAGGSDVSWLTFRYLFFALPFDTNLRASVELCRLRPWLVEQNNLMERGSA
jgi:hypothetical protein